MKKLFPGRNIKTDIQNGIVPKVLYKFFPINQFSLTTLLNSELFYSSPINFNDPWDCQIDEQTEWTEEKIYEFIKQMSSTEELKLNKVQEKQLRDPNWFNQILSNCIGQVVGATGIACFTENFDDYLMWSHYADGHKGICLEFDLTKDLSHFVDCYDVVYQDEYPKLQYQYSNGLDYDIVLRTKSTTWIYEKEWRNIKSKSGIYKFKPECLTKITFGINCTETNENAITEILNLPKYKHVEKTKAIRSKTEYKIIT